MIRNVKNKARPVSNPESIKNHHQFNGYIHLYTGDGKGKTTAALGLALRAAGSGKKVFIAQFVKGMAYSEIISLKHIPDIEIKQYGFNCFIVNQPVQKDIDAARNALEEVSGIIDQNKHDVVILDEICIAIHYQLLDIERVVALLKTKPREMEIVMTGRYASQDLIQVADLVTEMKEIKHYFNNGIKARKGIEF